MMTMDLVQLRIKLDPRCVPLYPTRYAEDRSHYLEVDDAQRSFDSFVGSHAAADDLGRRGRVVVITGPTGCGKTSLIHRCADWLRESLATYALVDLSDELWNETDTQTRIQRTFHRVMDEVGPRLTKDAVERLNNVAARDIADAFLRLSRAITTAREPFVTLILLAPGLTAKEIMSYGESAGAGLAFFSELSDEAQISECDRGIREVRSAKASMLHLTIGKLKDGDGKLLVDSVMRRETSLPGIPPAIVEKYFQTPNDSVSLLDLKRLAYGIRMLAEAERRTVVSMEDVADYYRMMMLGGR